MYYVTITHKMLDVNLSPFHSVCRLITWNITKGRIISLAVSLSPSTINTGSVTLYNASRQNWGQICIIWIVLNVGIMRFPNNDHSTLHDSYIWMDHIIYISLDYDPNNCLISFRSWGNESWPPSQAFEFKKYLASCKSHCYKYLGELSGVPLTITMH